MLFSEMRQGAFISAWAFIKMNMIFCVVNRRKILNGRLEISFLS